MLNRFRPKKARPEFSDSAIFSSFWHKNDYVPEKIVVWDNIFEVNIFVLKYVLEDSVSIPN